MDTPRKCADCEAEAVVGVQGVWVCVVHMDARLAAMKEQLKRFVGDRRHS